MQHLLRRKIIYIIVGILALPCAGFCQLRDNMVLNNPDHDSQPFHFGINVGFNQSHFGFTHHPRFLQYDTVNTVESINSTGLNLAWLVNFNINEHFDIRTYPLDLTFTEKAFEYNLKYPDFDEVNPVVKKVQSISLTFPVQIKFSSDRINNFKVYTIAGFKAEYDMASNAGARKAENLIKLKKLDYGVEAGIGFHFYFPIFVLSPELKVGWGLGNLHARDESLKFSNVIDKINSRMISFSLTVE